MIRYLVWFLAFSFSGCATFVEMNQRINRFESPEASGDHGSAGAAYITTHNVVLTSDYESRQPNASHPEQSKAGPDFAGAANISILPGLEVGGDVAVLAPWRAKAKYQFLGARRAQADAGNLSAAVTLAIGGGHGSGGTSKHAIMDYAYKKDTSVDVYDGALIAGYRPIKDLMVYVGGYYTYQSHYGHLETLRASTQAVLSSTDFKAELRTFGANLGAEYSFGLRGILRGELAWGRSTIGDLVIEGIYPAGQIGFVF